MAVHNILLLLSTDPLRHFFFRLHPSQGTLSWRDERGGEEVGVATVLEVHDGPSSTLQQSTLYSPGEHTHTYTRTTNAHTRTTNAHTHTHTHTPQTHTHTYTHTHTQQCTK